MNGVTVYVSMDVAVSLTIGQVLGLYNEPTPDVLTAADVRKSIRDSRTVAEFLGDWGLASWDDAEVQIVMADGTRIDVHEVLR